VRRIHAAPRPREPTHPHPRWGAVANEEQWVKAGRETMPVWGELDLCFKSNKLPYSLNVGS
ncbi:hypothetical protein, partial [Stenotrophomonas sp. GZD-301]|uniref:hypothetical protein n=1 Tax=Stenotrophomonas sp. GZD-301 TaxID=3404814 RepID=UPI003BB51631